MFLGTPPESSSTSPVQEDIPDPRSSDSGSDHTLSFLSHNMLPCWATQAQNDLIQAVEDLRQIQVRHASEIETVNRGVERAILGVRREEKRLLERVEQDHRDTQQRLEQIQRENIAAARVSQSLLEQRLDNLVQFQQRLQTEGQSVQSENGPIQNPLLKEILEFLQPWDISVSLKRVNFKPSSQPNAVTFGDIQVQQQDMCLNVGGCGPDGKLCALHSQEIHCEDTHHQIHIGEKNMQGQGWTSPTGRVIRRINLSNCSDLQTEEQKLSSAKIHQWLPKCEQFEWETSQVDDMSTSSLAVSSALENKDIKVKSTVHSMTIDGDYFSPSNHKKMTSLAASRKPSPSPERKCESAKVTGYSSQRNIGGDKGKGSHDSSCRPWHHGSCTLSSQKMTFVSQSCLDITSKARTYSRQSQSSDEHSQGTLGDSGRAPSPADSLDSSYTFIVSPSNDFSLSKGSLNKSFHLSKSAVDLTHKTRPWISTSANKQRLSRVKSGNYNNTLSRGFRVFERGQIPQYPNSAEHDILPQSKQTPTTTTLQQVPVVRSLSMSFIDGSCQEQKRIRGEGEEHALMELEEEVDPSLTALKASGAHLMGQFGRQGSGRSDLTLPSGIHATPHGQLFVVDCGNARVQVTDPQGNVLQQVTSPNISGSSRRCRNYFDIAVNSKGLIALSCAAERALLVFSRHGRLLEIFGGSGLGSAKDELEAPRGVTVTRLDEFLVADIKKGNLIALKLDPKTGCRLERTVVTGFHRPYLVAACLSSGIVAVSERGNETGRVPCIKVLEPGWNTVRVLGVCAGMGPVLTCPWGICIDKESNILVADWGEEHRVVLYPAQGIGWPIITQGLSSPRGLTLLPDGQLAVSDSMHHCIKIYKYKGSHV
uniref:E3 ubiquitin-protein ligase TRIM32 n=1 Tax=Cyprinodon variegatus TaxID=28743 RepID=A0A3Q2C734_CYPVA